MIQNTHYRFYRYTSEGFALPGGTKRFFSQETGEKILEKYKKNLKGSLCQAEAKKLQTALNKMVNEQSENYNKLVDYFIEKLNNELYNALAALNNSGRGAVVRKKGASFLLSTKAAQNYEKEIKDIAKRYLGEDNVKADAGIPEIISQLNGKLNKLRGDIFENILAYVLDDSVKIAGNEIEIKTENLLAGFINNGSVIKSGSKTSKVTGSERKESITITLGRRGYTISGSQGKTDVRIGCLDGDISSGIGVSAKSYTSRRRIHLVSSANLAGLVSQWPVKEVEKSLAMNAFSSRDAKENQYNISKQIFLLQALMGTPGVDFLSELFIINKNTSKNPFIVLSTYDLIFGDNKLIGDFSDFSTLSVPRNEENFYNFVTSTTISILIQQRFSDLAAIANN